jgi:hypothetical protein
MQKSNINNLMPKEKSGDTLKQEQVNRVHESKNSGKSEKTFSGIRSSECSAGHSEV